MLYAALSLKGSLYFVSMNYFTAKSQQGNINWKKALKI